MAPENIVVLSPYKYTSEHLMIKDLVEKEGLLAPLNKDYSGDKVRIGCRRRYCENGSNSRP